ncbi:hypothetical protein EVAR_3538_1 [Eumeta japonica]|uniref:Uncharacterized protein n=1 Tax=Eumeta variegata TaxID=151549 RepID=A0A4C1SVH7_EUMVA|nr:hypothetical protein EVAR_3538_1 [Eumeta japonica]
MIISEDELISASGPKLEVKMDRGLNQESNRVQERNSDWNRNRTSADSRIGLEIGSRIVAGMRMDIETTGIELATSQPNRRVPHSSDRAVRHAAPMSRIDFVARMMLRAERPPKNKRCFPITINFREFQPHRRHEPQHLGNRAALLFVP